MFCLELYKITLYILAEISNFNKLLRRILTKISMPPAVRDHTDKAGTLQRNHLLHIYTGGSLVRSSFSSSMENKISSPPGTSSCVETLRGNAISDVQL